MNVQATRDVRGAMLLEKIAEAESVVVADEEVDNEIDQMAGYYQVSNEQMLESLEQQGGRGMIATIFERARLSKRLSKKRK